MYIFGSLVMRTTRALMAVLIIFLLLVPVVICNFLENVKARLAVIIISTILLIAILSGLTKTRTIEMLVSGATYVVISSLKMDTDTVGEPRYAIFLTVFVSGTTPDGKAQS